MNQIEALSQAEMYIRHNQIEDARTMLGGILREDPNNEEAWILSAQVSDKPEQVLYCLHRAIEINPISSRARIILDQLQHTISPSTASASLPTTTKSEQVTPSGESSPDLPASHRQANTDSEMTGVELPTLTPQPYTNLETTTPGPQRSNTIIEPPSPIPNLEPAFPGTAVAPEAQTVTLPKEPELESVQPKTGPADQLRGQLEIRKRPRRWLQRIFTIAGTACFWAPWILMQNGDGTTRAYSGAQILLESFHSSLGPDLVIAALAALALPVLIFFRFQSGLTQRWGERATIALAPMAALPALELIATFFTGATAIIALHWGIWLNCGFYLLAGLIALINARRLGSMSRKELSAARAGWIFTWFFSIGNILAILVTVAALILLGKFSLIGIAIPIVWLALGAFLSQFA